MLVRGGGGDTVTMSPSFMISPQEVDEVSKKTNNIMIEYQVHMFLLEFDPQFLFPVNQQIWESTEGH